MPGSDCENDGENGGGKGDGERLSTDGETGIPLKEVFGCLASPRRRSILYYLQDNEIVDVHDLADHVAALEAGKPPEDVATDERDRIEIELVHNHLPRLAKAQFLEYDRRTGTIRYTQPSPLLDSALQVLSRLGGRSGQ